MTGKTHLVGGIIAGEIVVLCTHTTDIPAIVNIMTVAAISALVPDIDHPYSRISKKGWLTKQVSKATTSVLKHRGFTHTAFFAVICAFITGFVASLLPVLRYDPLTVSAATLCGIFSHLVLDSFNPTGIMWLWPESVEHFSWAKIRTGKKGDKRVCAFLSIIATAGLCYMAYKQINLNEIKSAVSEAASLAQNSLPTPNV